MVWWRDGFRFDLRITPSGFLIALIYALACWATRQLSLDQFYLPAGVRVAALLLCPPRLWPYLFLGEWAYFAQMRYPLIEKYGWVWAVAASATLMPAVAIIVGSHRRRLGSTNDAWILSIAALAALVVTTLNVTLSQLLWTNPPSIPFWTRFARYSVGDFVGILCIAPLALLWIRRDADPGWFLRSVGTSGLCVFTMLCLGMAANHASPDGLISRVSFQLMLAVPAIGLTCIHGWRGAAVGVPLLNLIIGATTPSADRFSFDAGTFLTQQIMAVTGVALLSLGSRISHFYHQHSIRDVNELTARNQVRSSHIVSEMNLRDRALRMRSLGEGIDHSLSEIAHWLRKKNHDQLAADLLRISVANSRQFRAQTSMVFPTSLEHVGLYLALQIGGISEAWRDSGRVGEPRLVGDPCQLSVGLQLAAYRSLSEAVSLLLDMEKGNIKLSVRSGRLGKRRGILISIALTEPTRALSATTIAHAIERLTGRTLGYDGEVQCHRNRLRIAFLDTPEESTGKGTTWQRM